MNMNIKQITNSNQQYTKQCINKHVNHICVYLNIIFAYKHFHIAKCFFDIPLLLVKSLRNKNRAASFLNKDKKLCYNTIF